MKKYSILLGAAIALLSFASCQKEVDVNAPETDVNKHIPFELNAGVPQTKTTIDAETWDMDWEEGDIIYAVTTDAEWGEAYASDKDGETIADFTYSGGKFATASTISDGEHTFNFLYTANESQRSYHRGASTSFSLVSAQSEDASAPTSAIKMNDVLVGQVTATTPTTFANVSMQHLFTLMKVTLKNKTGEDIVVNKFEMSASDAVLAGIFNVTFGEAPSISLKQSGKDNVSVEITNGSIAVNGELPVYFVMAPLSNYEGDITFTVTDTEGGVYTKTNTMTGVTFNAGEYNTASFSLKPIEKPIYATSFDYDQVGTNYDSSNPIIGSDGEGSTTSWEIVYGNWAGSNSAQLRVYKAGNFGSLYNTFDCSKVTYVTYSAKVSNIALKLNTYYSIDKGSTWTKVDDAKELTTVASDYSFVVSETGAYNRVRIKFEAAGSAPSNSNYQLTIDDVKIWGDGEVLVDATISADNITNVPAAGVEDGTANYTVNFTDDVKVSSFTGCVTAATASNGTITYSVAPNYTVSAKTGTIVLASEADPATAKTINVSQLASSGLSVSETTVTIPVDASSTTFTLTTADFGWNSEVAQADNMNLSINPTSGDASESAQIITVSSTTQATADIQTLGTIVLYRNGNTSDTQKKTITVKKAAMVTAGKVTYTVATNTSVTTTGSAPDGSSASYTQTYSTAGQMTKNNTITLTLSGYSGVKITGAEVSVKSNSKAGAGYLLLSSGDNTIASIGSSTNGVAFNNDAWNGEYSSSFVTKVLTVSETTVGEDMTVVLTIGATVNSLYFESLTLYYE